MTLFEMFLICIYMKYMSKIIFLLAFYVPSYVINKFLIVLIEFQILVSMSESSPAEVKAAEPTPQPKVILNYLKKFSIYIVFIC